MAIKRNFKIKTPLYHGTAYDFRWVDVTKGKDYREFGRGFYLAYQKTQAVGMAYKSKEKRESYGASNTTPVVFTYDVDNSVLSKLNIKVFDCADMEWLDFILLCRRSKGVSHNYDVVIGPTSDDNTKLCMDSYIAGSYGEISSYDAKRTLLKNLEVDKLGIQVCINTEKGLSIILEDSRKEDYNI